MVFGVDDIVLAALIPSLVSGVTSFISSQRKTRQASIERDRAFNVERQEFLKQTQAFSDFLRLQAGASGLVFTGAPALQALQKTGLANLSKSFFG